MGALRVFRSANGLRMPLTRSVAGRYYSAPAQPVTSPFAPRHLLSISDLTPTEFTTLVRNAAHYKQLVKSGFVPTYLKSSLLGKSIALTFSKRSTRTRVSTESAVALMGGHPMFLGSGDIQLGVNESLYDTSVVISSMVDGIVARVNGHDDVANLAKNSSVPVINALSDAYHPLQTIADFLTLHEAYPSTSTTQSPSSLGLEGLKLAWVGDANNVLYDLAVGAAKQGLVLSVATPEGYAIPEPFRNEIKAAVPEHGPFRLNETTSPTTAVQNADVIVTDTWISMGQEAETAQRKADFAGFQVTEALAKEGGAKPGWKFMHCLPRHPEEVSDEVFYSPRSLVFPEAENRLWAALSVLEAFVVHKGEIRDARELEWELQEREAQGHGAEREALERELSKFD